jgi:serine/threonine-protein kinase RsbW
MGTHFELKVEGKLENLPALIDFVISSLRSMHASDGCAFDVQLAVDEIATNIIKYAYWKKPGPIWTSLSLDGDRVIVVIRDEGRPFDPTKVSPPELGRNIEDMAVGGLGIYLAKKVMGSIDYSHADGQNVLTMTRPVR